jgi:hypothetical protein
MNPIPCVPCCTTPQTVNIPGSPGATGPQGETGADGPAGADGADGTTLEAPTTTYGVDTPPKALSNSFANMLATALVLADAGTWMLWARLKTDLNGATFAAEQTLTAKLVRTNHSAADIANAISEITIPIVTTKTWSLPVMPLPVVSYVATAADELQIMAKLSANPSAGSVDANEAEIVALKII